jgi:hypothetical protein
VQNQLAADHPQRENGWRAVKPKMCADMKINRLKPPTIYPMLGINRQQTLNLGHVGQQHERMNTPKRGQCHFVLRPNMPQGRQDWR